MRRLLLLLLLPTSASSEFRWVFFHRVFCQTLKAIEDFALVCGYITVMIVDLRENWSIFGDDSSGVSIRSHSSALQRINWPKRRRRTFWMGKRRSEWTAKTVFVMPVNYPSMANVLRTWRCNHSGVRRHWNSNDRYECDVRGNVRVC